MGLGSVTAASVTLVAAAMAAPSVLLTPRNGMLTLGMGPSKGGSAVALLIITTAAAPWRAPKVARSTRAQVPRSVTTSLPVMTESTYSASSQPSDTPPVVVRSTTTSSGPGGSGSPLASMAVSVAPPLSVRSAPGNCS